MHSSIILALAATAAANPTSWGSGPWGGSWGKSSWEKGWEKGSWASSSWANGLTNASMSKSMDGKAICVQGDVEVTAATSKNLDLALPIAANETVVVQTIVDMLKAGSTFMADVVKGNMSAVSGTYKINARICYPTSGTVSDTIQFLTHGIGFDKTYWDVAPGYSYTDVAAMNGYPTFSYDRLGVGLSDHPAAANAVVQAPLEVEIAHTLIQMLRDGKFANKSFPKVVGVGHSFGSAITQSLTMQYPTLIDAAVLTGFTAGSSGIATFTTALDLTIASENVPSRFANLNNGYLITNNIVGNQFAFFKAQGFPYSNLVLAENTKQTVTFGELISLSAVVGVAKEYTGPIDVVDGDSDWPFCMGNCTVPMNQAAAVKGALYPMASDKSQYYLAPNCGHGVNLHYAATGAYNQIQAFVKSVGL